MNVQTEVQGEGEGETKEKKTREGGVAHGTGQWGADGVWKRANFSGCMENVSMHLQKIDFGDLHAKNMLKRKA